VARSTLACVAWTVAVVACRESEPAAPTVSPDGCRGCHGAADEGPAGYHAAVDCRACHAGDGSGRDEASAHVGLEAEPGALDRIDETCGRVGCHPSEAQRVRASPMATAVGIVGVNRFALGETSSVVLSRTLPDVLAKGDPTPAEDHLRRLCGGCHLGARADNRDDFVRSEGSGCSACHLSPARQPGAHPGLPLAPTDDRCFGCHSRSARVSLSYAGMFEVRHPSQCNLPDRLADGRVVCRTPPDVHRAAGMACVDCHLEPELMGDGEPPRRGREHVQVRCETCHDPLGPDEITWGDLRGTVAADLARRHGEDRSPASPARRTEAGTGLWNLRAEAGRWILKSKTTGADHVVPPTPDDADHGRAGHERLSCAACHSTRAPRCPTCHTGYDPNRQQWDFGRATEAAGAWVETNDGFGFGPPSLAVNGDRIVPAVPGMIFTAEGPGLSARRRWYSAFDPHTTRTRARSCASCHWNGSALGYGDVELALDGPEPALTVRRRDTEGWPLGAWIRPLSATGGGSQPRLRSLTADEQGRVLRVGRCLKCHEKSDTVFQSFSKSLSEASMAPFCRGRDLTDMKRGFNPDP
jgi:hypothetical protein